MSCVSLSRARLLSETRARTTRRARATEGADLVAA
jgi:hypothetical protein